MCGQRGCELGVTRMCVVEVGVSQFEECVCHVGML